MTLTDAEAEELSNLRRLLCIPADTYREIEQATKGRIFQVRQAMPDLCRAPHLALAEQLSR